MATGQDERNELDLLERVFLRIGMAESDEQLEKCLFQFLAPSILKASSPYDSVQKKVLELLTHVSKRLKSRSNVKLPMDALLTQFSNPESAPQVVNFSLVYIKQGFPRLSSSDQAKMIPTLLNALDGRTTQQQDGILQLVLPALVHLELPKDLSQRKALFNLDQNPKTQTALLDFLLYYLLLPYGEIDVQLFPAPPGLSQSLVARVTGGSLLEADQLEKVKNAALQLLASEIFTADEIIVHLLVAAGDPRHSVTDRGDSLLKQFGSSVNWDSPVVVGKLFSLYQGTVVTPGKRTSLRQSTSPKETRSPASLRVRLRMMPYFLKSTYAANCFPSCIQVIFDSLFGNITNTKLRVQMLQFVHHICYKGTDQKLTMMAPVMLTGLSKIIDQPDEDEKLHVLAYTGIGSLAKQTPQLFQKDTKYLVKIFEALKKKLPTDVGLAVQECLSLMAAAYRGTKGQNALIIEALLLENIYASDVQLRLAAVQYALSVFDFDHVPARFVCVIACGDSKEEVREEGKIGLRKPAADDGAWENRSRDLPNFTRMVQYLHKRASLALESGQTYSVATGKLPFPPPTLMEAISFLRACLAHSAKVTEEQKLTNNTLPSISRYLTQVVETDNERLTEYFDLLIQSLGPAASSELYSVAMAALLEATVASPPTSIALRLTKDINWIRKFTHSSHAETREPAGRLLGVLAASLEQQAFMNLAEEVLKATSSETYNIQHGAIVSLGYVTANCLSCLQNSDKSTSPAGRDDFVKRVIKRLVEIATTASISQLSMSACASLGEVLRSGPLPLPKGRDLSSSASLSDNGEGGEDKREQNSKDVLTGKGNELTQQDLVTCLSKLLKSAKDIKTKERCSLSLGYLSVGNPGFPLKHLVLEALFQLREEKAIELQFTIGEAIACTVGGAFCSASHDPWRFRQRAHDEPSVVDTEVMGWALETILTKFAVGTSPLVRQASCVWLLTALKLAGKHPDIQPFLKHIQMTFMNMLTERSDVTQEVASRGMGLVYDMSESSQKEALVGMLVGTLLEGRKSNEAVTGDTKLFQEGELGKVPHGGSLSTYKELCSLASDLNKPELVYKFMHLANHNALWNSRKGAAFGFGSIASQAQEQLASYLPTLVPRLYRYKYDPNPRIQLAMANIWSAVIPESKKAVDKYFKEILADLKENLNSSLWRNRESSCVALSDLLVSRQVSEVIESLPQLWELILRVRDDVKESVRKAADIACKSLHKVTVRACDGATMDKTGKRVAESVLPLLLSKGMANPSTEVQAISLVTVLKISQNAGPLLKPHVSVLVPTLLESLSSLEYQKLNEISLQLSGEAAVQEKLDDLRVAAARSSPMMEVINLCVPQVDTEVLPMLTTKLIDILKSGVGLGTKVATANVIISLVRQCMFDLTPYAGKVFTALLPGLSDRSSSVRKAHAKAIGYLMKVAKDASVSKVIGKLKTRYLDRDESSAKSGIAHTFHAMSIHSPDSAKKVASEILPLVFLAMHATAKEDEPQTETDIKLWKETWNELVPSTEAGVRLHLAELVAMACPALESQSWTIKAQGASAIATITEKMKENLGPPHLSTLMKALLNGLQGRTWEGKETVLKAVKTLCKSCKASVVDPQDTSQPSPQEIAKSMLAQCKKKDQQYKMAAIEATGSVLQALKVDVFSEFYDILHQIIKPDKAESESDDETESKRLSSAAKLNLQATAFQAIGLAWPDSTQTQAEWYSKVSQLLSSSLPRNNWKVQVASLESLSTVYASMKYTLNESEKEYLGSDVVPSLCQCLGNVKYSAVRHSALTSLDKLTDYLQEVGYMHALPAEVQAMTRESLRTCTVDHQRKKQVDSVLTKLCS